MSAQMLFRFMVTAKMAFTFGEARRLVRSGRVLVNEQRAAREDQIISDSDLVRLDYATCRQREMNRCA